MCACVWVGACRGGGQCHHTTCLPQQKRDGTDAREASVPTDVSAESVINESRRMKSEKKEAKEFEDQTVMAPASDSIHRHKRTPH